MKCRVLAEDRWAAVNYRVIDRAIDIVTCCFRARSSLSGRGDLLWSRSGQQLKKWPSAGCK